MMGVRLLSRRHDLPMSEGWEMELALLQKELYS
jgi:hypothetical protein